MLVALLHQMVAIEPGMVRTPGYIGWGSCSAVRMGPAAPDGGHGARNG